MAGPGRITRKVRLFSLAAGGVSGAWRAPNQAGMIASARSVLATLPVARAKARV
ncbi:hypothetical protein [Acetobacter fallax]|uniref:Uncharacterized protein n=1 Tax=Acetobacter fallax TaxID=1737473 RepID=A0ABX0KFD3_9PROT|nr:hypothetical protein [Acetobacter fallax]NHO33120.1 hypothetical protein [Acetobacter fallax]